MTDLWYGGAGKEDEGQKGLRVLDLGGKGGGGELLMWGSWEGEEVIYMLKKKV